MLLKPKNNNAAPVATIEQLQVFFDAVKDIPKKNNGGCLFFCYIFFLWLKKNGYNTNSFSIIQYSAGWDKECIVQNDAFIRGESDRATSSAHFTWLYNGAEYDAEGTPTYRTNTFSELKGLQTRYGSLVKCFCENALQNGSWNPQFNRNAAIDIIKQRMKLPISKKVRW